MGLRSHSAEIMKLAKHVAFILLIHVLKFRGRKKSKGLFVSQNMVFSDFRKTFLVTSKTVKKLINDLFEKIYKIHFLKCGYILHKNTETLIKFDILALIRNKGICSKYL